MEWREYKQAWRRRAFAGSLGKAQAYTGIFALLLSPLGLWWKPFGDAMSWMPTLIFAVALACLLAYGFLKAPHWLHKAVERERDDLREELTRADRIEGILVELGGMRLRGVSLRNDLAKKDVLEKKDEEELEEWHSTTRVSVIKTFGTIEPAS